MKYSHPELRRINHLIAELDWIYHQAALKFSLSDSEFAILYTICCEGDGLGITELVRLCGMPKQTMNSALRKMEKEGLITLTDTDGRKKAVHLTEKGTERSKATVVRLIEIENGILTSWGVARSEHYTEETREYNRLMKEGIEKL
ncbi:MAG: MarR family winged helix-turn-helix transcriptional regulator [Bullifex sp.]